MARSGNLIAERLRISSSRCGAGPARPRRRSPAPPPAGAELSAALCRPMLAVRSRSSLLLGSALRPPAAGRIKVKLVPELVRIFVPEELRPGRLCVP